MEENNTRRTWATALQIPHLQAHLHWWQAYYHFVRPHASLRVSARSAIRARRQAESTPVSATDTCDGSRANQAQMDRRRSARLPASTDPCLRAGEARNRPTKWRRDG
jgi:hypothetical protein